LAVHESLLRLVQRPPPGLRFEATTRRHPPWPLDRLRRASPDTLVEALTEREHVVLRYLASTLSNAEIAAELYLLINTVKTDQRMVYRKLGATGCRDAIRRAKQLRIL
jgi:LuxR family maltose regulon positive regulatory protein